MVATPRDVVSAVDVSNITVYRTASDQHISSGSMCWLGLTTLVYS